MKKGRSKKPAKKLPCKPGTWECSINHKCYGSREECMDNCKGGHCNAH